MRRLGLGTDESHRRRQAALDTLWPYALQLFVPVDGEAALTAAGMVPESATVRGDWEALTGETLRDADLIIPTGAKAAATDRREHGQRLPALLEEMQSVARLAGPEVGW